jgi:hypothetical protein
MGDINRFRADLDREKNGTWIVDRESGISLKIASIDHNPQFQEALRTAVDARKMLFETKELNEEQHLDAFREAVAKTILLDWKDMTENGESVPYSWEKVLAWFRDPEMWRLPEFVVQEARRESNFRKELVRDAIKN